MTLQQDAFTISTDKQRLQVPYIWQFLAQTYWAKDIPLPVVQRSIEGSLCFGVYEGEKQVGFARVITDSATFAYFADVFIDPAYQGRGLSKWLLEVILAYPELQGLRRFLLATRDAHGLYRKMGFETIASVDPWMQIHRPEVYQKSGNP